MGENIKTFVFHQKNGNATIILSALDFNDAEENLHDIVEDSLGWRCEDEDGEDKY